MNTNDRISARQIQLIQGAVRILMEQLYFSKEEALMVISESLKEELRSSNITFEFLELGSLSTRQVFVRNLVYRVDKKIQPITKMPKEKIKAAIESFVKLLHESWSNK